LQSDRYLGAIHFEAGFGCKYFVCDSKTLQHFQDGGLLVFGRNLQRQPVKGVDIRERNDIGHTPARASNEQV
jgi:hypothetical protein